MIRREKIPAVVADQTVTALGTLRSLARVGIEAFTVTAPGDIVRHSRSYMVSVSLDEVEGAMSSVLCLLRRLGRPLKWLRGRMHRIA